MDGEHWTQTKKISPQGTKAIEQHLAAMEREEMTGIIERPAKLQSKYNRLAENRFAALSEDEEEKYGGYATVNELCATNKARGNKNNFYYRNMNMANRTMSFEDDEASVGTTYSAETVKRSNTMPSRARTRGEAWNVIKQRNWVQQTIVDQDRRWCPTNIEKKLSPANRVGAINKEYLGKLLDNTNELTWACADSGCTANICIPGTPLKNLRPTSKPIRLKTANGEWIETTHEGEIDIPGLPPAARRAHICPDLANMSLIGIKTLVDAGCEVLFSQDDCIVLYEGNIVWKGGRQARSGLWILPLSPGGVEEMTKLQVSPTKWANAVEQLRQEAETRQTIEEGQVNNAFHTTTKAELIKYLH